MLVADAIAEARRQQLRDFFARACQQIALALAAQDQRFDFLEVVDRNRPHETVLALGEERAGTDEAEQLVVDLARRDQVYRSDPVAQRARDRAQLGASAGSTLLAHFACDPAKLD